jgi:hypothetical protein
MAAILVGSEVCGARLREDEDTLGPDAADEASKLPWRVLLLPRWLCFSMQWP